MRHLPARLYTASMNEPTAMNQTTAEHRRVLEEVRSALRSEARRRPVDQVELDYRDGVLTLAGEVHSIAVKRLLLEHAAAHPDVTGILDRLHVTPAQPMGDGEVRDHVTAALLQDAALSEIAVYEHVKGDALCVRDPPVERHGEITVAVAGGLVTLDGDVPSLAHKRLAGVLAWWVPGSRDVINGLGVTNPEPDLDAEITDAVRMVLEKDPFVDASQIRVFTLNSVVNLHGIVPVDAEREMAEFDAWYVFGVDKVENRLHVHAAEPTGQHG